MTEHKFTDEEIIKAFECCHSYDAADCSQCSYKRETHKVGVSCVNVLIADALDLINRQKAEIAYWQDEAVNAKKEAVKAFAERLKKYYASLGGNTAAGCVEYHIDQIAKEMIGETQ